MADSKSPFEKEKFVEDFEKEATVYEKFVDYGKVSAEKYFLWLLPTEDLKDLPKRYMYPFGGLLILSLFGVFVALFISGYNTNLNQVFLSPLINSYTPSSYCETISVANTGTFLGTQDGYWEGQAGFSYSNAAYKVSVTGFTVSYDTYKKNMTGIYNDLVGIGKLATTQDLGVNILYWLAYTVSPTVENLAQSFSLVGQPEVVFNREEIVGTISSYKGPCNASSYSGFDGSTGKLITRFSHDSFMQYEACRVTVAPISFGYLEGANDGIFYASIDTSTLAVSMALNFGIMHFEQLTEITAFQTTYVYDETVYNVSWYYDNQFPAMDPLVCITNPIIKQCIVRISSYFYALPIFNHLGSDTDQPRKCNCNEKANNPQYYGICDEFNFLAGFIVYNTSVASPDLLFALSEKFNYDFKLLNEYAYNASYWSSYWGQSSPYSANLTEESYRELFEFCNINGSYCTIMTYSVFDNFEYSWAISDNYFQLFYGSCVDSFSVPWETW
jgi:hypothetical protein